MTSFNPLSDSIELLREIVEKIDLRPNHFAEDNDKWSKFCVSMDSLEDSDLAISFFLMEGFGDIEGEQYLRLYGILQAIVIQQDAIKALWKIVFGEDTSDNIPQPSGQIIKRFRNHIAHPIEVDRDRERKGIIRRTFVNRSALIYGRLSLITDEHLEESKHWEVVLRDIVLNYLKETKPILQNVYKTIQEKWFGNEC